MADSETQQPAQAGDPVTALCPHCRTALLNVAWTVNQQFGLVTFFHNDPACRVALNCQLIKVEPKRVLTPSEIQALTGRPQ